IVENRLNENYKPYFYGSMNRYYSSDEFKYVLYGNNLKEKPGSYTFFVDERIIVRRIVNRQFRVMATLTHEEVVFKKDYYIIKLKNKNINAKYLLAILNSQLISFLKTKGSNAAKKDDFTQLTLNDIREI